jgi:hypothetical protein
MPTKKRKHRKYSPEQEEELLKAGKSANQSREIAKLSKLWKIPHNTLAGKIGRMKKVKLKKNTTRLKRGVNADQSSSIYKTVGDLLIHVGKNNDGKKLEFSLDQIKNISFTENQTMMIELR